jgi:glycogen phosphorylase
MNGERQMKNFPEREIVRGLDAKSIGRDVVEKLFFELAKFPGVATRNDHFLALAYAVRDRLLHRWVSSARLFLQEKHRTVIYLSAEYLIGPQLAANLLNLDIEAPVRNALENLGLSLDELVEHEEEPGLGNGGLGRLAACFMDSLATLKIPAIGHGLRYEFGIFDQEIRDGWQVERTDRWLRHGNPWEIRRHDIEHKVGFGGTTHREPDDRGGFRVVWTPERFITGIPFDTPVPGHGVTNTNFLRLWSAVAAEEFDLDAFQVGEYWRAVDAKIRSENVTKVLYPNDQSPAGKQLRLEQQAFFVSCALQDSIRLLLQVGNIREFADKFVIQLNDTHPALAVPELMRLLVDEHDVGWDDAWGITTRAFNYTNHTLLPEALETWPLPMMARLLPRHMEIIFEINRRFLDEVRARFPGDDGRVRRLSIIDEHGERSVRMVHLATIASQRVNGVAPLHSRLLRETLLPDFAEMYPDKFTNVTNGVTPRRFLALANPPLTRLIGESKIEGDWVCELDKLRALEPRAEDAGFRERWRAVKNANKQALARWLAAGHGEPQARPLDPTALLDAQCKRFHEYKRQHLNLLHIISLWDRLRRGDDAGQVPRTFLFAGKAAPGYWLAKLIIRLIHGVAEAIDADPRARQMLNVVFVPDFNVKVAEHLYPAADLSEQISTAGREASGTGNMKFALNGALTIGTLDGANVDLRDAVGADNFFLFGLNAEEASHRWLSGHWPRIVLEKDPELAGIIDLISSGAFSRGDRNLFAPLVRSLTETDPFLVLADFRSYVDAQKRVAAAWLDRERWTRSSILNVARAGAFSSDRAIREYSTRIWRVAPVDVPAPPTAT